MYNYNLWFCLAGLSDLAKYKLLLEYITTEKIYHKLLSENFYNKINLNYGALKGKIEKLELLMEKDNIHLSIYGDMNYPKRLMNYNEAPPFIFYKGNIQTFFEEYNVSIVGSRNCSDYGRNITKAITKELCYYNVKIISGLAKGIDTVAQTTAVNNDGFTCAILGCGIDIVYPRENRFLEERILEKGCIISEFLPGTNPMPYNFPRRNRIISGLSDAVIVVEATIKSGAMTTANHAADQGIEVFSVPGSILSEVSQGTNRLINEGAAIFTGLDDIASKLNIKFVKNANEGKPNLTAFENKIFNLINDIPVHIDELNRITSVDIKQLYGVLFELQLKNEIMCLAGNFYVREINKI